MVIVGFLTVTGGSWSNDLEVGCSFHICSNIYLRCCQALYCISELICYVLVWQFGNWMCVLQYSYVRRQ